MNGLARKSLSLFSAGIVVGLVSAHSNAEAQTGAIPGTRTWTVSPSPEVQIGSDADPRTTFTRVTAVRSPAGEIVIEDNGTAELRVFSSAGAFRRNLSRRGAGPGEYQLRALLAKSRDTVFVVENPPGARQIHAFTVSAGFVERTPLRADNAPKGVSALARLASGRFLVSAGSGFRVLDPNLQAGVLSRDSITLGILTVGDPGTVAWIGILPNATQITYASPFLKGQATFMNTTLGPFLVTGASADQVWLGDSGSGEITILNSAAAAVRRITMPLPARPLNEKAADIARQRAVASAANDNGRARAEAQLAKSSWPTTMPRFASFVAGVEGEMWVALFAEDLSTPSQYLVMDRNGKPIAQVTLPPNVAPTDIGRDYVLGRHTDPDGVESVVLYRLTR